MKCPECNGTAITKEVNKYGNFNCSFCATCHGTGEVVGNSEQLKSRSVQRREALQKGEPMPEFDKPEMPDGIRIKRLDSGYLRVVDSEPEDWNYLSTDKVRELVRLHEDFRDLLLKYRFTPGVPDELNAKAEEIDNLQSALFPEGLEQGGRG